ncbi:glycoside hydrolase family 26 protein [Olivibacter sitiensis]|uniref:glycoside hydrolase family 26 protein n=1 Tax=Olivibacter sitiensis TaxID=376470 RepID=UPI000414EF10|nr:glycosyl hydrolase [Olivibacter sitiensis]
MNTNYGLFLISLIIAACTSVEMPKTADTKATKETKNLYASLKAIQGKKILFGHQDATVYGIGWKYDKDQSDIKKISGDYPAVYGWDLGHIELGDSVNLDNIHFDLMRQHIISAYRRGGINTISWHLRNPYTNGSSWDVSSNKVVASIIPGGEKHARYLQWLDSLSLFLSSLVDDSGKAIPVLLRPFHEHTGNWFWWGAPYCSKEDYITLWKSTAEYLRNVKQVHNVLYIYSPDRVTSEEEYFDRFPGDDYVDILGLDMYHRGGESQASTFVTEVQQVMNILEEYAQKHDKVFVFSETGAEGIPMSDWFTAVLYPSIEMHKPAYVLVWRNAHDIEGHHYAPYPGHPSVDDFLLFKSKKDIYFEKNLPNLYKTTKD